MKEYNILMLTSVFMLGACQQDVKQTSHPEGLLALLFRNTGDGWRIVNSFSKIQ